MAFLDVKPAQPDGAEGTTVVEGHPRQWKTVPTDFTNSAVAPPGPVRWLGLMSPLAPA